MILYWKILFTTIFLYERRHPFFTFVVSKISRVDDESPLIFSEDENNEVVKASSLASTAPNLSPNRSFEGGDIGERYVPKYSCIRYKIIRNNSISILQDMCALKKSKITNTSIHEWSSRFQISNNSKTKSKRRSKQSCRGTRILCVCYNKVSTVTKLINWCKSAYPFFTPGLLFKSAFASVQSWLSSKSISDEPSPVQLSTLSEPEADKMHSDKITGSSVSKRWEFSWDNKNCETIAQWKKPWLVDDCPYVFRTRLAGKKKVEKKKRVTVKPLAAKQRPSMSTISGWVLWDNQCISEYIHLRFSNCWLLAR